MKHFNVAVAVVLKDKKVLCVKNGIKKAKEATNKWEFAGGKIEQGESVEAALVREIKEELSMDIVPIAPLIETFYQYQDFSVTLNAYICKSAQNGLVLKEHIDFVWVDCSVLASLDFVAADIPIMEAVVNFLGRQ